MDDLIAALQIFRKYTDDRCPTFCTDKVLIVDINPSLVSTEDTLKLESLSFSPSEEYPVFMSFRFGG